MAKKKAATKKRRNQQDATLRNIRALKKAVVELGDRIWLLETRAGLRIGKRGVGR